MKIDKNMISTFIMSMLFSLITFGCDSAEYNKDTIVSDSDLHKGYSIKTENLAMRDPFILPVEKEGLYYLHVRAKGEYNNKAMKYYTSKDLKFWKYEGLSFIADDTFWGKTDFWAPDTYYYDGKYYIFSTFSAPGVKRGTSILVSDSPRGPFKPLVNAAVTPASWECLDGALHVDDTGAPWILYCHEWLQVKDGEVVAQKLTKDLTATDGDPILLFKASSAPWVGNITSGTGVVGKVTDAPFIHKTNDGKLIMLWSSFNHRGKYAIGQAISESGSLLGPWKQSDEPLNDDTGGHAMLFKAFDGKLMISYHSPNASNERAVVREVKVENDKIVFADSNISNPDEVIPSVLRIPLYSGEPTDGGNGLDPLKTTDNGTVISGNTKAELYVYRPSKAKATGHVIIACPGGGYQTLAYKELTKFAEKSVEKGVSFIILNYRIPNGKSQIPINDIAETIKLCRQKKETWNIDADKIGVLGVSAGGHLASIIAVTNDNAIKPDFSILVYPVITMLDGTHLVSKQNFLGANPTSEMMNKYSNELHVTATTPRTYIVYGLNDQVVNINANAKKYIQALFDKNVPHMVGEYPNQAHSISNYPETLYTSILSWVVEK